MNSFIILFEAFCGLTPFEEHFLELNNEPHQIPEKTKTEDEIISLFLQFSDRLEKCFPPS